MPSIKGTKYRIDGEWVDEVDNAYLTYDATSTVGLGLVVDEDNMASNSATKLTTQQAAKAYVDTKWKKWLGTDAAYTRLPTVTTYDDETLYAVTGPSIQITDDFNRANSTGLGPNWIDNPNVNDRWDVVSNQAVSSTTFAPIFHAQPMSIPDVFVSIDLVGTTSGQQAGVIFRSQNALGEYDNCYYVIISPSGGIGVYKVISGVETTVSISGAPGAVITFPFTGTLRAELVDGTIEVYVNGVLYQTHVDPSPLETQWNAYVGMVGATGSTVNNFAAGDMV